MERRPLRSAIQIEDYHIEREPTLRNPDNIMADLEAQRRNPDNIMADPEAQVSNRGGRKSRRYMSRKSYRSSRRRSSRRRRR
jgi:hypothetical protein